MLILTKKIFNAHKGTSFNSFFVTGKRSIGKSSYSLRALQGAFVELGHTENESWRLALGSLKFSIKDVCNYLEEAIEKDERKLCLIWDDTRIYGSGAMYHMNVKLVSQLIGLLDTIRTSVSNLIMTAPSSKGMLTVLQHYEDYLIKIRYSERGSDYRTASGYIKTFIPSGQKRIYLKFRDEYPVRLPGWVYDTYMKDRKQALAIILKKLKKLPIDE